MKLPPLVDVNERAFLKSDHDGDRSSYKLLHHQAQQILLDQVFVDLGHCDVGLPCQIDQGSPVVFISSGRAVKAGSTGAKR